MNKIKTGKRELATLCILALFVMAGFGMIEAVGILAVPVFGFAGLAFGMDSASKQFNSANPSGNSNLPVGGDYGGEDE